MTTDPAPALPSALPTGFRPRVGLVLGSGLDPVVESIDALAEIAWREIPGHPVSGVPGHAGRYLFGRLGATDLVIARGRVHLYEGFGAREVCAGVRAMAAFGVERLLLTNAAGTLAPAHPPGHWMLVRDHLNLTGASPFEGDTPPVFHDMSAVYDAAWGARAADAASELGVALFEGVYAGVRGPQFETPAEVRMLRTLGADAVGMSTVLEAMQARALGLDVLALSCLTNWAAGMEGAALDHADVLAVGRQAAGQLVRLLPALLEATPP